MAAKIFEVSDVLPATTKLRISWDNIVTDYSDTDGGIYSNDIEFIRWYFPESGAAVLIFLDGYSAITGGPDISAGYIDIDISHLDIDQRTITEVITDTPFYWEDMATYDYLSPRLFKAYDVLPATTQLRISWEYDIGYDGYKSVYTNYDLILITDFGGGYVEIDGTVIYDMDGLGGYDSNYTNGYGGHAYIDIDTSAWSLAKRTVTSIGSGSYDCYWEDLAPAPSSYTITFNSNGGTTISDIEEATELPTPLPTPTKSGYKFVAWYYESNLQTRAKAGDTIEANTTLYAKWHNLGSLFTEIADAIRSKDGTSENIRDVDFGERVKQIQGAIELTQAQYDALSVYDDNTYYLIVEE